MGTVRGDDYNGKGRDRTLHEEVRKATQTISHVCGVCHEQIEEGEKYRSMAMIAYGLFQYKVYHYWCL